MMIYLGIFTTAFAIWLAVNFKPSAVYYNWQRSRATKIRRSHMVFLSAGIADFADFPSPLPSAQVLSSSLDSS